MQVRKCHSTFPHVLILMLHCTALNTIVHCRGLNMGALFSNQADVCMYRHSEWPCACASVHMHLLVFLNAFDACHILHALHPSCLCFHILATTPAAAALLLDQQAFVDGVVLS